jgi:hypothetical protein
MNLKALLPRLKGGFCKNGGKWGQAWLMGVMVENTKKLIAI